jgi:hypothetical protein
MMTGAINLNIQVLLPGGVMSNEKPFKIVVVKPTLSSLKPAAAPKVGLDLTLNISGKNFAPGGVVLYNGAPFIATFLDSRHLTVLIPAASVTKAGSNSVQIQNPGGLKSIIKRIRVAQ